MANPYFDLPAGEARIRLLQVHANWLREMQQWQAAAWRHAALVYLGMLSLGWALPPPPPRPTVAERMASRSMWVVAGGKA